ncbi:synaptotagmin-like protein 2 isoform X1 [Lampetra fluviatilis]
MLDLSYLTEEEQRAILKVLKRDADLKQKEEDRCKILKKEVEDEKKLKVLTGEWFYEVKGKRHDDRLHGSDLVRASMRKGKSAPRPGDRGKAHSRDREDKENKHKSLQLEDCIANESSAGPTEAGAPRPSKRSEGLRSTSKSSLNQTPALGGTSASKEQGTSSSTKNSSFESDEVENEPNVKPADAESKPQTLAALAKLIDATDVAEVQTLLNVDVAPVAGADVSSGVPEAKPITKGSTESTKSGLGERAAAVAVAAAAPPVPRARTARPEVNGRELEETVKPSARQTPVKSAVKWGGDARPPPEPAEQNGAGDVSGVKRRPAVKLSGSLDSLIDESEDGAGPRGILKHSSMSSSDSSLDTPPNSRLMKAISDVHLTPEVMHEKSKSANEDSQGSTEDLEGRHVRFNSNIQQVEVETDFNSPGYTGEGNLDNSDESNSSEEEEEDEEEDKETEENTLKNAGTSSTNPFMNDEMAGDDLFKDFGMDDPAYKSNPFTNQFVEEPEHDLPSLNRHLKTAASDDFWAEDAELELPQSLDPAVPQRQPKVNNKSEDLLDDDSENEISSLKFASMQKQPKDAVSNLKDGTNENQLPSLKSTSVQMQPKIARSADLLAEDDENELPYSEPAGLRKPAKPDMKDDTGSTVQERVPTDSSKKPRQDGRTEIQKPPPSSTERSRHGDPDADDNSDGDDDNDEQRRIDRAGGDWQKKFAAEPLKEPSQQAIDDTGAVPSLDSDEEGWQSKMPTAQSQTSSLERTGKPKSLQYPSEPSAKTNIQASDGQQKDERQRLEERAQELEEQDPGVQLKPQKTVESSQTTTANRAKTEKKPMAKEPSERVRLPFGTEAKPDVKERIQDLFECDPADDIPAEQERSRKASEPGSAIKKTVKQTKPAKGESFEKKSLPANDENLFDFNTSVQLPDVSSIKPSSQTSSELESPKGKPERAEKPVAKDKLEKDSTPRRVGPLSFKTRVHQRVETSSSSPSNRRPVQGKTTGAPIVEEPTPVKKLEKSSRLIEKDPWKNESPEELQSFEARGKKLVESNKLVPEKPFESLKIPLEVEARREFKMKVQELIKNDPPVVEPRKEKTPAKAVVDKKRVPQRKDEDLLDFDSSEQEPEEEQPTVAASPPTQTEPEDVPKKAKKTEKPVKEKPFESLKIPLEVEARREFKMKVQELVKNDPPVVEPRKEKTPAKPVIEKKRVPQRKDEDLLDFDSSEQEPEKEQPTVAASPPTQTEPEDVPKKAKMTEKPVKEKPFESLKISLEVEARREFKMKVQELVKNDPPVVEPRKEKTPAKPVVEKKRVPQRKDEDLLDFDSSEQEPEKEQPTVAASPPTQTEPEDVPKKAKMTEKPIKEKPFESLKIPLEVEARREFKMKVQELVKNDPPVVEPRKEKTPAKPVVEKKRVPQRKDEDLLDFDSSEQEPEKEQPTVAASPPTQTEPQDVPKKAKMTEKPVKEKPFESLKIPLEVEARREFKMKVQELVKNDPPVVEPRKEKTLAKPVVEKKRVPQRKDEDLLDFDSSEQEPEKEQPTVAASPPTQTEPQDVPKKAKTTDKPVLEKPFKSLKIPLEVEARREFKMKVQELVKNDPPVVGPRKEKTLAKPVVEKKRVPQRKDEDLLDFDSSEQEPEKEQPTVAASPPTQTEPQDVPNKAKMTDKPVKEKPFESLKIPLEVEARREFKMKVQELVKNDPPVVEPRKEKTPAKVVVDKKRDPQRKDEDVLDFDSSEQEPAEEKPTAAASSPTQTEPEDVPKKAKVTDKPVSEKPFQSLKIPLEVEARREFKMKVQELVKNDPPVVEPRKEKTPAKPVVEKKQVSQRKDEDVLDFDSSEQEPEEEQPTASPPTQVKDVLKDSDNTYNKKHPDRPQDLNKRDPFAEAEQEVELEQSHSPPVEASDLFLKMKDLPKGRRLPDKTRQDPEDDSEKHNIQLLKGRPHELARINSDDDSFEKPSKIQSKDVRDAPPQPPRRPVEKRKEKAAMPPKSSDEETLPQRAKEQVKHGHKAADPRALSEEDKEPPSPVPEKRRPKEPSSADVTVAQNRPQGRQKSLPETTDQEATWSDDPEVGQMNRKEEVGSANAELSQSTPAIYTEINPAEKASSEKRPHKEPMSKQSKENIYEDPQGEDDDEVPSLPPRQGKLAGRNPSLDVKEVVARSAVSPQVERWLEDATAAATLPAAARSARAGELTDAERKKQMSRSVPVLTVSGEEGEQGIDIDSEDSGSFKLRRAPSDISSISGSMMSLYSDAGDYGNVDVKGEVNFALKYDDRRSELHVCVAQCRDLAAAVAKKGRSDPYVKTYLLPDKSRQSKKKTGIRKNNLNPVYNEILKYKIPARELQSRVLNLSVWHNDKFGKNSFLGEVEMELSTWDWGNTAYNWFDLQPRVHISQEDLTSRGYLNLALKFIPANSVGQFTPASGEIHIWVKEAKNLLPLKPHGVDAFVKCYILPDLSRKSRQKTRTVKKSMNPVFNHTMVYDGFQDEDMHEACVELTVWDQETFSNQFLGGLRLGLGGGMSYGKPVDWMDSREGEVAVWHNMITRPGEWTEALLPLRPDMVKSKAKK